METVAKPNVFLAKQTSWLTLLVKLLPALVILAAVQLYVFNLVYNLPSVRQLGWDRMMLAHGAQPGANGGSVVYAWEGTITQIGPNQLTLSGNGQQSRFSTPIARYFLVSSLTQPELWPTYLLAQDETNFQVGDNVTVIAKAAPLKTELPVVTQVLKVKTSP